MFGLMFLGMCSLKDGTVPRGIPLEVRFILAMPKTSAILLQTPSLVKAPLGSLSNARFDIIVHEIELKLKVKVGSL